MLLLPLLTLYVASSRSFTIQSSSRKSPYRIRQSLFVDNKPSSIPLRHLSIAATTNDDLFEYFDPLMSPHAYPNGISPENKPIEDQNMAEASPDPSTTVDRSSPQVVGFRTELSQPQEATRTETAASSAIDADTFDPTISPHSYGISRKTAILLVDHGSRNVASNEQLHVLARQFQTDSSNSIVRAAHMEIAAPSIPTGLHQLVQDYPDLEQITIVPYFLSAHGRHVVTDIPAIVQEAIEKGDRKLPLVVVTDPIGANVPLMMMAIQSMVESVSEK